MNIWVVCLVSALVPPAVDGASGLKSDSYASAPPPSSSRACPRQDCYDGIKLNDMDCDGDGYPDHACSDLLEGSTTFYSTKDNCAWVAIGLSDLDANSKCQQPYQYVDVVHGDYPGHCCRNNGALIKKKRGIFSNNQCALACSDDPACKYFSRSWYTCALCSECDHSSWTKRDTYSSSRKQAPIKAGDMVCVLKSFWLYNANHRMTTGDCSTVTAVSGNFVHISYHDEKYNKDREGVIYSKDVTMGNVEVRPAAQRLWDASIRGNVDAPAVEFLRRADFVAWSCLIVLAASIVLFMVRYKMRNRGQPSAIPLIELQEGEE